VERFVLRNCVGMEAQILTYGGTVMRLTAPDRRGQYADVVLGHLTLEDYVADEPEVVNRASVTAIAALDESFFRVRFDRLTPKERKYLRAMAELGPGPHRSGDIAESFGVGVSSLAPTRSSLILKGMVWSPNHGDTAFTVPMFDEFMNRVMPGNAWK